MMRVYRVISPVFGLMATIAIIMLAQPTNMPRHVGSESKRLVGGGAIAPCAKEVINSATRNCSNMTFTDGTPGMPTYKCDGTKIDQDCSAANTDTKQICKITVEVCDGKEFYLYSGSGKNGIPAVWVPMNRDCTKVNRNKADLEAATSCVVSVP